MQQGAKKRGITFDLTAEDLERWWRTTPEACEYCGSTPDEFKRLRDLVVSYTQFIMFYDGPTSSITLIRRH